ncbi:hypothetical protein LAWASA_495 [Lawsonibacter asaccharolyticus]|nr:hypothetical protein LAWASA_495 [Lawsonibacter asaccharolyticus]
MQEGIRQIDVHRRRTHSFIENKTGLLDREKQKKSKKRKLSVDN